MQWAACNRRKRRSRDRTHARQFHYNADNEEDEQEVSKTVKMKSETRQASGGGGTSADRHAPTTLAPKKENKTFQPVPNNSADVTKNKFLFPKSLWASTEYTLDPGGKTTYYWMGVVSAAVVYNCAVVIIRVTFHDLRERPVCQAVFFILDGLFDFVYLADILVQMRTGYLDDGCLVLEVPRLVKHYRKKSHFMTDILAILPFHSLYNILAGSLKSYKIRYLATGPTKLVVPFLRMFRLLKYQTLTRFFEISDSRTANPNILRAFKLSLYLWMVIHWIGCVYYMISEYEGLGSNEWVYPRLIHNTMTRKYIRCMFWSMMTLTTIGERPSPETDLEYVFTGLIFLIGVFVFAAVVGNVGDVISNMHHARQDFQSRMDNIKFYMQHRHIPEELQERVKRWAEYSWSRTQATDEPALLGYLPDGLRTEIALHVHLNTLKKVKMFEECEEGLLRDLVLKLRPQIFSPGDYICRTGEIGREMYILDHGKVEILVPNKTGDTFTQIAVLSPGNYFGEISLLKLGKNRRTADVRAIGYSQILCLSRKDLLSALVEYPDAKDILEKQAKERMIQMQASGAFNPFKQSAPEAFAEIIKSKGLQKIISLKGSEGMPASEGIAKSEVNELRQMINDLRNIKTQIRSEKVESLNRKCQSLEAELLKKDKELLKRNNRIIQLETMLKMKGVLSDKVSGIAPEVDSNGTDATDVKLSGPAALDTITDETDGKDAPDTSTLSHPSQNGSAPTEICAPTSTSDTSLPSGDGSLHVLLSADNSDDETTSNFNAS